MCRLCDEHCPLVHHHTSSYHITKSPRLCYLHAAVKPENGVISKMCSVLTFSTEIYVNTLLFDYYAVIFQPFFTVETSKYFRMRYAAVPGPSPKELKKSTAKAPPPRPPPPAPRKDGGAGKAVASHPVTIVSHPSTEKPPTNGKCSPSESQVLTEDATQKSASNLPKTALLVQQDDDPSSSDFATPTGETTNLTDDSHSATHKEQPKAYSEKKHSFRPKRLTSEPYGLSQAHDGSAADVMSKGNKPKVSFRFKAATKLIRHDHKHTTDTNLQPSGITASPVPSSVSEPCLVQQQEQNESEKQDPWMAYKDSASAKPTHQPVLAVRERHKNTSEGSKDVELTQTTRSGMRAPKRPPVDLPLLPEVVTLSEEEFTAVLEIHVCVLGQCLCVANAGGSVLAFNFQLDERESLPQVSYTDGAACLFQLISCSLSLQDNDCEF